VYKKEKTIMSIRHERSEGLILIIVFSRPKEGLRRRAAPLGATAPSGTPVLTRPPLRGKEET
jgi:hypothetical protein